MIGKLYRWLFDAHRHEWEIIGDHALVDAAKNRVGRMYELRCKTCGDIRFRQYTIFD